LEPVGKDTAPAIALAALTAEEDPLLLVLAADHVIQDVAAFDRAVSAAIPLAETGKLVTFGIVPNEPHVGYGYIKRGQQQGDSFVIDEFVEKPNSSLAQQYMDSGEYYWNSGMFLFKASSYLKELQKFRPKIYNACVASVENTSVDLDFLRINTSSFKLCPVESVDYAVMENTTEGVVVPMDPGWSDIGSWKSLWDISEKDASGNASYGDVVLHNSSDCYVRSDSKLVAAIGLKNIVVVATKDAVLVAHKDSVQDSKSIVQHLKAHSRTEWEVHREVYRPWGKYDSIDQGPRYQVKCITVNPGEKLSVQLHHHRAEHWIVVSGTARVLNGDNTFLLSENESTYIKVGSIHSLENPGKVPLELIEVQSGSYLGEDDIVRISDNYGRK
jgi:mannose-1-phosphate guanylyltransferase